MGIINFNIPSFSEQLVSTADRYDKLFEEDVLIEGEDIDVNHHSWYYTQAMNRLDQVFIPTQSDWHEAMKDKESLEKHGYKLDVGYPFEVGGGFHNIYERYLVLCGYEDETDYVEDLPF